MSFFRPASCRKVPPTPSHKSDPSVTKFVRKAINCWSNGSVYCIHSSFLGAGAIGSTLSSACSLVPVFSRTGTNLETDALGSILALSSAFL